MSPGRQVRLAEVGVAGQAKLEAARVPLASESALARDVEARYLVGAGVTIVSPNEAFASGSVPNARAAQAPLHEGPATDVASSASGVSCALSAGLSSGAREVALGALSALRAVREALGMNEERAS